jgi:predicted patatin/cPLA2 family phospholipase
LRDDVKIQFDNLLLHLDRKTHLLNTILDNTKHVSYLIRQKTDNEDEFLKYITGNSELIEKINIEDYNISAIKDTISQKYCFNSENIFLDICPASDIEIIECRKKIAFQKNILREIMTLNEQNYSNMHLTGNDIKQQISELQRMNRLQIIFPEDKKL